MPRKPNKIRRLAPGALALICDACEGIVTRGSQSSEGYLTLVQVAGADDQAEAKAYAWRIFHDSCRPVPSVGNPVVIRESRVSSYPLLLTTLAGLAVTVPGFRNTDWPTLLRRIVSDTEWWFDPEGGQMSMAQMMAAHSGSVRNAGLSQKLSETTGA